MSTTPSVDTAPQPPRSPAKIASSRGLETTLISLAISTALVTIPLVVADLQSGKPIDWRTIVTVALVSILTGGANALTALQSALRNEVQNGPTA